VRVIDSHTEGEPTRLILADGLDLGSGPLHERRSILAAGRDHVRRFCLNEPRGFDAVVGALLCEPCDPTCAAGLIFFNNRGYLGMCGHATIGAAVTLAHLGRIGPGRHRIETPVGIVSVTLDGRNTVTIDNVPAYVHRRNMTVSVDGLGRVTGDVAWGGNWFFVTEDLPCPLTLANVPELLKAAKSLRTALFTAGITGAGDAEIDHIELCGPGADGANSRNFVLCPSDSYDRSPCGTGTSAMLACLAVDGRLQPGESWVQESILGTRFAGTFFLGQDGEILPRITGRAWITAESTLVLEATDPFPHGIAPIVASSSQLLCPA
jgi:4-hydroxyproline epimerase